MKRIYDKPMHGQVSLLDQNKELDHIVEGTIEDIFYRFDTTIDNNLDYDELKEFFDSIGVNLTP